MVLASFAILYILGTLLSRFTHVIVLFSLGAITAYILTPMVNWLQRLVRVRWLAILVSYIAVAMGLFALGLLLVTPFVQQAQSLVDNLHTPASGSLKTVTHVQTDMGKLRDDLVNLQLIAQPGVSQGTTSDVEQAVSLVRTDVVRLMTTDLSDLRNGTLAAQSHASQACRSRGPERLTPCPQPQTQVPPSYVRKVETQINLLNGDFQVVSGDTEGSVRNGSLKKAIADAKSALVAIGDVKNRLSESPIILLRSQTFLDQHNIRFDLLSRLGDLDKQISNQGANLLDNAIVIVQKTTNILLNTTLVLIIAFYLLSDGSRLIRAGLRLVPATYREEARYFVVSTDKVMGDYLRGQIFLSALAGVLGGGGAAVLGVPYPLLIGIITFLLESVPVIGPLVAMFPAVIISLFFMPLSKTIILAVWFILFQQVVTNVLGPRIMGMAVGIHPLEALFAVLVGYPIAGFLGAFLAVPVMGIFHILIREAYRYFVLGHAIPTVAAPMTEAPTSDPQSSAAVGAGATADAAQLKGTG